MKFGLSKVYFLCFAPTGIRKKSYSSSFANFHFENEGVSQEILSYLGEYTSVSVREGYSRDELRDFDINAEMMIDPTLLLTKDMWAVTLNIAQSSRTSLICWFRHEQP